MATKRLSQVVKIAVPGLPLAAAVATSFLPLREIGRQLIMLFVLIWIQVYFIYEIFLARKKD